MTTLVPLVVAVPFLVAALLAGLGHLAPRRVDHLVAIAVSGGVTVLCVLLVFGSGDETIHYWFGGWTPRDGIALGISFSVDPLAAGVAALIGVLATAALVVSWDYFDEPPQHHFHSLMLAFLGALVGFALSSDLFNMFVFFELMSVAAFALTGYRVEQPSALQGAIAFAVVNTVGAFLLLTGIALAYGRTGALNLAQIGEALAGREADGLVIVSFTLLVAGFLTKAGAVPFHFWLSDAYAVAPAPVCIVFAGVMSDLALHAIGRVYWDGFSGALDADAVRTVLIAVGIATALVGAVMAFVQAALKRMLAFVVISHVGVFLAAIGLLSATGLAGASVYVVADGLVKGALFCAVASLARQIGHTDEFVAHGRARTLRVTGALVAVGALGLAALPPLAAFGDGRLAAVLVIPSALTGAAVLRAAARIFRGLGPRRDDLLVSVPPDEEAETRAAPRRGALLWVPALVLLAAGVGLAFVPRLSERATAHAAQAVDRPAVARELLHGAAPPPLSHHAFDASTYAFGGVAALAALALGWFGLYRPRFPALVVRPLDRLKLLHDGLVGDYVTWLTVGTAALGALFAVFAR